jgi:hypothetical protein
MKEFAEILNRRGYIHYPHIDAKYKIIYDFKFGYPNLTPAQLNKSIQMQRYFKAW